MLWHIAGGSIPYRFISMKCSRKFPKEIEDLVLENRA
jgi:hypothetical protein